MSGIAALNGHGFVFRAPNGAEGSVSTASVTEEMIVAEAGKGLPAAKAFFAKYGLALADNSAQETIVLGWLKNKYSGYPALALNIIRVLGGKKIKQGPGDGQPSLMTINGSVTQALGKGNLNPMEKVADATIKAAVLERWNERNSCCAVSAFDQLLEPIK